MQIIDRDYVAIIDKEFEKPDKKTGEKRPRALFKYDAVFKNICLNNLWFTKKLIINCLHLKLDPDKCKIKPLGNELIKDTINEYHNTADLYFVLNEKIYIALEMNTEHFNEVKHRNFVIMCKQYTGILKSGENAKSLENKDLYQINFNDKHYKRNLPEEVIKMFNITKNEIYLDNFQIVLKHLDKYYDLYYNEDEEKDIELCFLAAMKAKTFTEVYDILSNVLNEKELDKIVGGMIKMSFDEAFAHLWEPELLAEEVRQQTIKNATRVGISKGRKQGILKGRKQGIEQNKIEIAKTMLTKNFNINNIAEITGLPLQTIKELQNKCQ